MIPIMADDVTFVKTNISLLDSWIILCYNFSVFLAIGWYLHWIYTPLDWLHLIYVCWYPTYYISLRIWIIIVDMCFAHVAFLL